MINLTIDLEQEDPRVSDRKKRRTLCSVEGTEKLLELLQKHSIKATFFVSGFFAEHCPDIVRGIISEGHEVACNGYHDSYKRLDKVSIQEDIEKAKKVLEDVGDIRIIGFRAPQMMYVPEVVEHLEKAGFLYDSTLQSAWKPGEYNHKLAPLKPFYPLRAGPFVEIPISGSPRLRLPLNSQMMRKLGSRWFVRSCKKLVDDGFNPVVSIHSWDLRPVKGNSLPKHYLKKTGADFVMMLERFLQSFNAGEFVMLKDVLPTVPKTEALKQDRK